MNFSVVLSSNIVLCLLTRVHSTRIHNLHFFLLIWSPMFDFNVSPWTTAFQFEVPPLLFLGSGWFLSCIPCNNCMGWNTQSSWWCFSSDGVYFGRYIQTTFEYCPDGLVDLAWRSITSGILWSRKKKKKLYNSILCIQMLSLRLQNYNKFPKPHSWVFGI